MSDLLLRFDGYDELKPLLSGSDEDVLVRLGKPTLIRIPGTDPQPRARLVAALLHGNEDSGYHAVLDVLRTGARFPFDWWVFIGNVRAAMQDGWYAHRYLDGQEDFNRVWGLGPPTTRMRRCASEVLAILEDQPVEAALDIHNTTGHNPYHAILSTVTPAGVRLAATCSDILLEWHQRAYTLMEALDHRCPALAVECGLPGLPDSHAYAAGVLERFLSAPTTEAGVGDPARPRPEQTYEVLHRVEVRPEVRFAFGAPAATMTDEAAELDLVLHPGLDGYNFGMMLAGTELGRIDPGAAMPLCATDRYGRDVTDRYFTTTADGRLLITEDVTPVMMVTTVVQTRRDCLFYIARRRA